LERKLHFRPEELPSVYEEAERMTEKVSVAGI